MRLKWLLMGLTILAMVAFVSCSDDESGPTDGGQPKTTLKKPDVRTDGVSVTTQTTAICQGSVTSGNGLTVGARGLCWDVDTLPTLADNSVQVGTGLGTYATTLTGLAGRTKYYLAAYATNDSGTSYGETFVFHTTDSNGTVTDIDGNVYKTVKIGDQWWMAENLKVEHYRNGDDITYAAHDSMWVFADTTETGAYCYDSNGVFNGNPYGFLYNWHATVDARNIAPAGWQVPDSAEWNTLIAFLGGKSIAGRKLKSLGTGYWDGPNDASNESGFSALPGGYRLAFGQFFGIDTVAAFHSTVVKDSIRAWGIQLNNQEPWALTAFSYLKSYGVAIRCVRIED